MDYFINILQFKLVLCWRLVMCFQSNDFKNSNQLNTLSGFLNINFMENISHPKLNSQILKRDKNDLHKYLN